MASLQNNFILSTAERKKSQNTSLRILLVLHVPLDQVALESTYGYFAVRNKEAPAR